MSRSPTQSLHGIVGLVVLLSAIPPAAAQQVVLTDVPNYPYNTAIPGKDYIPGCGPVSAVDILGTYDLRGAIDLIASPLDDICLLHEDYMDTSPDGYGGPVDFHYGMKEFAHDRGYEIDVVLHLEPSLYNPSLWTDYPYGSDHRADAGFWNTQSGGESTWTIDNQKFLDFLAAEIDAGRPTSIIVDANGLLDGGETGPDHWMVAVGYDRAAQRWAGYNTIDSDIQWYSIDSAWREGNFFGVAYLQTVEFNGVEKKWDGNGGGPGGSFGADSSWDPDGVPTAENSATFDLAQTYIVDLNVDATNIDANVSFGDVTLRSSGGMHLYTLTGDLTVAEMADLTLRDMFCDVEESVCVRDGASLTLEQDTGMSMGIPAGANVPKVLIGDGPASAGTVTVDDSYWTDAHTLVIGGFGDGSLTVRNTGMLTCNTAYVAQWEGSISDATVTGADSEWWVANALYIGGREDGNGGWGSVVVESGGHLDTGPIVVWNDSALACFGGTVRTDSFDNSHGGVFNFTGGTFTVTGGAFEPGAGDFFLQGPDNPTLVLEDGAAFSKATAHIGSVDGMSGTLTLRDPDTSWQCSSYFKVGFEGAGHLNVAGGADLVTNHAWIADKATAVGVAVVEGEGSTWTSLGGGISVGTYGNGTMTVRDGGYVSCPLVTVAAIPGSSGTVVVGNNNALWECAGSFYVGGHIGTPGGSGEVNVNQFGAVEVADTLKIWSGGTVTVAGAYALVQADKVELAGGHMNVGTWGSLCANTLVGFGPAPSFGGNLYFGHSEGTADYTVAAGETLAVAGDLEVGHDASALLTVNETGILATGSFAGSYALVGAAEGSNGSVVISGPDAAWYNSGELHVGYQGTGEVTVSGGASMSSGYAFVGDQGTGQGTVTVSGPQSEWNSTGTLFIGTYGTGTLSVEGGGEVSCDDANIGTNPQSQGDVSIAGQDSHWHVSDWLTVGLQGHGEMALSLGATVWCDEGLVAMQSESEGIVSVDGENSGWTCNDGLVLGGFGEGDLAVSNGGTVRCGDVVLGAGTASRGVLEVVHADSSFEAQGSMWVGGSNTSEGGVGLLTLGGGGRAAIGDVMKIWPGGDVEVNEGTLVVDTLELAGGIFRPNADSDIQANTLVGLPDEMAFYGWLTIGHSGGTGVGNHAVSGPQSLGIAGGLIIASDAQAYFSVLNGGSVSAGGVYLGLEPNSSGTVGLAGADTTLSSLAVMSVGQEGAGLLTIANGATASSMFGTYVGAMPDAVGTVNVHGGGTWANMWDLVVGYNGRGTVSQTGGETTVGAGLYIGLEEGSHGEYAISGGSLETLGMYVGLGGPGTLSIDDPSAAVEVQVELTLGPHALFSAAPGSKIHMTGSAFTNQSTDSSNVSGLQNIEMIFEGGLTGLDPFEVSGRDMGPVLAGFENNFVLGTLRIGGDQIGRVQLVDLIVNQLATPSGPEALYVRRLILDDGSYLDLNGLNLYCMYFEDFGGTLQADGGQLVCMAIPGDANGDGAVTDADYTVWADHYGQCGVGAAQGDFNGDGCVTDADYTIWADHYGQGTGASVPEPGAALLVVAGGLVIALRSRCRDIPVRETTM